MTDANGSNHPYAPYNQENSYMNQNRTSQSSPYQRPSDYSQSSPYGQPQPTQKFVGPADTRPDYRAYQAPTPQNYGGGQHATAKAPKADHKKMGTGRTFLYGFAGAALACVVGLGGFGAWSAMTGTADAAPAPQTQQASIQLGATQNTPVTAASEDVTLPEVVAEKCLPSVVAVDVYAEMSSGMSQMYKILGYEVDDEPVQSSTGSGVVMTSDGYIITNNHVVDGGSQVKVTIEGEEYDAEIVGTDPSSDIAVLKAQNASGLTPMDLGDSDNLSIGEWVMTLGSPFGLEQSVATGIVSATSRSQILSAGTDAYGNTTDATIYPNLIQTDAAINPGNSGGALVNSDGALIGINTLITSYSGNYSGVGFAIPVNYAVSIAEQIIDGQTPSHAQLGVSLSTVSSQNANLYGLTVDKGAYISNVFSGTGAADAGLKQGDIVTAFDGKAVESADDLLLDVRSKQPGDKVTLTVVSGGETREVEVTLGSDAKSANAQEETTDDQGSQGDAGDDQGQDDGTGENQGRGYEDGQGQGRGTNPNGGYGYGYDDGYDGGYGEGEGDGGRGYGYGYDTESILDELFGLMN